MRTKAPAKDTSKRILAMALFLGTWMLLIIGRLIWLQVVKHDHYLARAAQNQTMQAETLATRGPILDRNGKELAVSVIFDSVFADQKLLKDAAERQKAEAELASVDAEIKKTQDFKDRLQTGGFRNEREMLAAMPESMRADYQQTMAQKGPDNTARVNGSAVESGISARANLGAQFSSAAPGTKLTPATADDLSVAAPDTPAANHYRYQPGGLQPSFGVKLG